MDKCNQSICPHWTTSYELMNYMKLFGLVVAISSSLPPLELRACNPPCVRPCVSFMFIFFKWHLHGRSDNDDHDIHHDESHARYVIYEQRHEPPTNIVRLANQNKQGLILAEGLRAAPPVAAEAACAVASTAALAANCVREQGQM
jgi:hypothetical protein